MLDKITKAVSCAMIPCLDKDFVPATLWDREFRKAVNASGKSKDIVIAVERNPEKCQYLSDRRIRQRRRLRNGGKRQAR